jgi:hypothetical protein
VPTFSETFPPDGDVTLWQVMLNLFMGVLGKVDLASSHGTVTEENSHKVGP